MSMIEIKAYIRRSKVDAVVQGLQSVGINTISIILVEGIGALADPAHSQLSIDDVIKYSTVCKLELVCLKKDLDIVLHNIESLAKTGEPGDGVIFISPIERAIKIRTGEDSYYFLDMIEADEEQSNES